MPASPLMFLSMFFLISFNVNCSIWKAVLYQELVFSLEQESFFLLSIHLHLHGHTMQASLWSVREAKMKWGTVSYLSSKELLSEKCIWLPFPAELCLFEMFKKSIDPTSNRLAFAGCVKAQTSFCVTPKSGLHKHPVPLTLYPRTSPGYCSFVLSQVSGWEGRQ